MNTQKPLCDDVEKLQDTVKTIDRLSQEHFTAIAGIARLTLKEIEGDRFSGSQSEVCAMLRVIWDQADVAMNQINVDAEEVGCNYENVGSLRSSVCIATKEKAHG